MLKSFKESPGSFPQVVGHRLWQEISILNDSLDALIKRHGTLHHVAAKALSSCLPDIIRYMRNLNGQMAVMSRITITTSKTRSNRVNFK